MTVLKYKISKITTFHWLLTCKYDYFLRNDDP